MHVASRMVHKTTGSCLTSVSADLSRARLGQVLVCVCVCACPRRGHQNLEALTSIEDIRVRLPHSTLWVCGGVKVVYDPVWLAGCSKDKPGVHVQSKGPGLTCKQPDMTSKISGDTRDKHAHRLGSKMLQETRATASRAQGGLRAQCRHIWQSHGVSG